MSARQRRWSQDRGATVVEFALILPVLFTMLMGIVEYGFGFARQSIVTNAAREGARAGSNEAKASTAQTTAQTTALSFLTRNSITGGTVTVTTSPVQGRDAVKVVVSVPWKRLTGFGFLPVPGHNTAVAVMRLP